MFRLLISSFFIFIFNIIISAQTSESLVKTSLIFRFSQLIEWENESSIDTFRFGLLTHDSILISEFNTIYKTKKLRSKQITFFVDKEIDSYDNMHCIFIDYDFRKYLNDVAKQTYKKGVLIITYNSPDLLLTMLNIYKQKKDKTLKFEVNKLNLDKNGFVYKPDLLLYGASLVDIRELYLSVNHQLNAKALELDSINNDLIDLKIEELMSGMDSMEITFRELCGYDIGEVEKPIIIGVPNEDEALEFFKKNHPAVMMFSGRERLVEIGKKIVKGEALPKIGGFVGLHHGLPGLNIMGENWTTYFQIGIKIGVNIFDWGKSKKRNEINNYRMEKINKMRENLIRKTRFRLTSLYKKLESLRNRLITAEKMVKVSEEESDLKKLMFVEKQISNREYLDSVLNLESLESKRNGIKLKMNLITVEINTLTEE